MSIGDLVRHASRRQGYEIHMLDDCELGEYRGSARLQRPPFLPLRRAWSWWADRGGRHPR